MVRIKEKSNDRLKCDDLCLLMLVEYYKAIHTTSSTITSNWAVSRETVLQRIIKVADKSGLTAYKSLSDLNSIRELNKSVILHLNINSVEHFVVFFSYDYSEDLYTVGDPQFGIATYSSEELAMAWSSRICLILERSSILSPVTTNYTTKISVN